MTILNKVVETCALALVFAVCFVIWMPIIEVIVDKAIGG